MIRRSTWCCHDKMSGSVLSPRRARNDMDARRLNARELAEYHGASGIGLDRHDVACSGAQRKRGPYTHVGTHIEHDSARYGFEEGTKNLRANLRRNPACDRRG